MERCMVFLYAICFATVSCVRVSSSAHSETMDQLFSKNIYSKEANEETVALSEQQVRALRLVFRGINVDVTALKPILDGQALVESPIDWGEAVERMQRDQTFRTTLMELLSDYEKNGYEYDDVEHDAEDIRAEPHHETRQDNEYPRVEYEGQQGGYEGCRRDYASFIEPLTDRLLSNVHEETCEEDPEFCIETPLVDPYRNMTDWGMTMLDALGKLPSAIMDGNFHWSGSFNLCKNLKVNYEYYNHTYLDQGVATENRTFTGEYCRVDLSSPNSSFTLALGICVPDTCSRTDIQRYIAQDNIVLSTILEDNLGMNLTYVWCGHILDGSSDAGFIVAVSIIVIIAVICIAATIYDVGFRRKVMAKYGDYLRPSLQMYAGSSTSPSTEENDGKMPPSRQFSSVSTISSGSDVVENANPQLKFQSQLSTTSQSHLFGRSMSMYDIEYEKATWKDRLEVAFVGFSFYSNLARIFSTKTKKDHLECMNGLRFFSFCWLILGHTWLFGPVYADSWVSMNVVRAVATLPTYFSFQYIVNFLFQSDTFFLISGTLTSYWWLKHYEASGQKLKRTFLVYYFVHRYWRLLPAYMFGMMFLVTLYQYLGPHGVFIPHIVNDLNNCHANWWRNLLFIHNFFRDDQCLTWTWYFAIVLQLHIMAFIALVPLVKKPKLGYAIIAALWVTHVAITAGVASTVYQEDGWIANFGDWYFDIMQAPWCRAGPYIVGMALGVILFETKCTYKMHWAQSLLGWLLALFVIFMVIYSTYDMYREGGELWSPAALIAYDSLARSAWGVGVAWIVFACSTGNGNIMTMFLSLKIYQPFCRLIYPGYMLHSMMIFSYMYGQLAPFYIDIKSVNYTFLGNIVIVYLASLFIALWFHYPIAIGLERALLCKNKLQAIMSGCHPNDHILRYLDDRYHGHAQPWSLGGAKLTGNHPPAFFKDPRETGATDSEADVQKTEMKDASKLTCEEKPDVAIHTEIGLQTREEIIEDIQPDGTILQRQVSITAF